MNARSLIRLKRGIELILKWNLMLQMNQTAGKPWGVGAQMI